MTSDAFAKKIAPEFCKYQTPKEMADFLMGVLTYKERAEIATRLEIVRRLKDGQPQHQIAADLGVGVATVTRGSKEIQQGRFARD